MNAETIDLDAKLNYHFSIVDKVLGEDGLLSQRIEGYEIRHSQIEGIKRCIESLGFFRN